MAVILESVGASGDVQRTLLTEGVNSVRALPGIRYRLVDSAGGRVAETALIKRVGDDLVIEGLSEGRSVSLEGFFTRCAPGDSCSMSMENIGGSADETVVPSTQPVAALSDGSFLMYASGSAAPALPKAPEAEGSYKPALAGLAGLALVGAGGGGGGGGGGGAAADTTPPDAPIITSGIYTNQLRPVIAGRAEPGSTVTVTLDVGSDGSSDVTYSTQTGPDGIWSIDTATAAPIVGSLPTLAEGVPTEIRALARDAAGNASGITIGSLILDITPPAPPTITSALLTNDATPVIRGGADAGSIVSVGLDLDGNGTVDVAWVATAGSLGTYVVDLGSAPASGTLPGGKLGDVSSTNLIVVASDLAGNVSSPPTTAVLTVDTRLPDAPVIDTIAGDNAINALEAGSPITISGTISEADRPVTVQWGTLTGAATVTGRIWTITFSSAEIPADGLQTVTVTYVGAAGSTSIAGTQDVLIDRVTPGAPAISLNPISDTGIVGDGITADDTPTIRVALTGTGAAAGDTVTLFSGTTRVGSELLDPSDISAGFVDIVADPLGADGVKTLTATITDAVGNVSASSAALALTIDRTAPTLAITDDVPGTATGPVTFTFTFSEPVTGFTAEDIVVAGGTKGTFTEVSGGLVYSLIVTPTPDTDGQITVDVPAGAAVDVAGTANLAAPQAVQPYTLAVPPSLTITDNVAGTATGPITYTFTFSEPVTGFTADDITVTGAAKGAFATVNASTYTLVVNPPANATGTIGVSVPAGAATDLSGNASLGPVNAAAQPFDTAAPTLTITDNVAGTATGPITYTFTFSEPVTDFTADDIAVTGGATKGAFSGSGSTYTLVVNPPADATGTIGVSVAAGAATDLAGNPNTAASAEPQPFDTAVPVVTIADVIDDFGADTGSIPSGGTTDDNTPTLVLNFSELFDAGASVEIFRDGSLIGTLTPTGTNNAEFTDAPLADDTYQYTARMTDAAGNVGSLSLVYQVTIDTTP